MMPLPDRYPLALASTAKLLEWAHHENPPFAAMRIVTGWLKRNDEIRIYFDGVVQGNAYRWKFGYFLEQNAQ